MTVVAVVAVAAVMMVVVAVAVTRTVRHGCECASVNPRPDGGLTGTKPRIPSIGGTAMRGARPKGSWSQLGLLSRMCSGV
jgi:hypothetical protein